MTIVAVASAHSNWVMENGKKTRAWLEEQSLEGGWELETQNEGKRGRLKLKEKCRKNYGERN